MRGRPRKPTALKILEGNRGHRPLPVGEPKPPLGAKPPADLSIPGRHEWARLAPILDRMGVLTEADADTLAELCEAKALLKVSFSTELWRAIQACEAKFGLTPSDRARLSVKSQEPETKLGKFRGRA